MAAPTTTFHQHPVFARVYTRMAAGLEHRGAADIRRRLLAGLSGTVVEVGAGTGTDPAEIPDADAGAWPEHLGQQDLTPWLLRRLRLCRHEAREFVTALDQLQPGAKT